MRVLACKSIANNFVFKHRDCNASPGCVKLRRKIAKIALAATFLAGTGVVSGAPSLGRLVSFGVPSQSAANPSAELIEGSDGKLYGTAPIGGATGQGIVFRIAKDGSGFLIVHSFTGTN